jgi:drug/metabolite transporter (DMT)-like permease
VAGELSPEAGGAPDRFDLASIGLCTLIWGTTWLGIKFQLGLVDPVASIVWRFSLAGLAVFGWTALRKQRLGLTRRQHGLALVQGVAVFAVGYMCVYIAEQHAPSGLVAVVYATLAVVNMAVFRLVLGQKSPMGAWVGAVLGAIGVGALSAGQILHSSLQGDLLIGVGLTFVSVLANALANLCNRWASSSETGNTGALVAPMTGWSMLYGSAVLGVFGLVTGVKFNPPAELSYWLGLIYLSLAGSTAAFLLYYGLASRRGFTLASYIGAMTPLVAMAASSLFEHVHWDLSALAGLIFIVAGQVLIIRQSRAKA